MTTRWRRAGRRRTSWHNQQNCIKTQGGRHKKRTALLVYPFKSRSAASVSASAAPDASSPLFCWNWRSACSVSAPKSPSAPCRGRGKPAAAANRADDQPDAVAVAVRAVAPQSVARISRLNPPYIRQKFVDGHVFTPIQPMRKDGLGCKKKTEQPQKPLRHQFTLNYASTRKA